MDVLNVERGPFILSPFVLAELDYFVLTRLGIGIEDKVLGDVTQGAYELCPMAAADIEQARQLTRRYADLKIGLADASIVVLAARYETTRILTFDERRFRTVKPLWGSAFTLLPGDAR
jgi:predicted nucleic acid-binding protein